MTGILFGLFALVTLSAAQQPQPNIWNPFKDPFDFSKFNTPNGFGFAPFPNPFGSNSGQPGSGGSSFFQPMTFPSFQFTPFDWSKFGFTGFGGPAPVPQPTTTGNVNPAAPSPVSQPPTQPVSNASPTVPAPVPQTQPPAVVQPQPQVQQPQPVPAPVQPAPTPAPLPQPIPEQSPATPPVSSGLTSGQFTVTNRTCTEDKAGHFFGITPNANDPCGSVECTCYKGIYICYSTCNPPPANQTCTANIPAGSPDICPTYTDCGPVPDPNLGNAQIFRCNGPVHPSVCWLYEIMFGGLTEPLGFFESVAEGCPLSTHCLCNNGFVTAANLRPEDFKTPANNLLFPRAQQGNQGTIAAANLPKK